MRTFVIPGRHIDKAIVVPFAIARNWLSEDRHMPRARKRMSYVVTTIAAATASTSPTRNTTAVCSTQKYFPLPPSKAAPSSHTYSRCIRTNTAHDNTANTPFACGLELLVHPTAFTCRSQQAQDSNFRMPRSRVKDPFDAGVFDNLACFQDAFMT